MERGGSRWAFFKPSGHGLTRHPKDAFDATQTWTFIVGGEDSFLLLGGVTYCRIKNAALAALLAAILLLAFGIVAVLYKVCALAVRTTVGDGFTNHGGQFSTSFESQPLSIY